MATIFPGTKIEVTVLQKGASKQLFDGVFAAGGITLSQISVMTGLEPHVIQNWVKRGFLTSPVKRLYSREQFARIIIINMLREALQIDKICGLLHVIEGEVNDPDDDLISNEELYHRYVNMLADNNINTADERSVLMAAERETEDFSGATPNARRQLIYILQVMIYAHAASTYRRSAEEMLASLH